MTRQDIETALNTGRLEVLTLSNKWYRARRNGQTKLWKTRPNEFRVPVKFGFSGHGVITHLNLNHDIWRIT